MKFSGDDSSFSLSEAQEMDILVNQLSESFGEVIDNASNKNLFDMNSGCKNIGNSPSNSSIISLTRSDSTVFLGHTPSSGSIFRFMPTPTLSPDLFLKPSPAPSPILPQKCIQINPLTKPNLDIGASNLCRPLSSSLDRYNSPFLSFLDMSYQPNLCSIDSMPSNVPFHLDYDLRSSALMQGPKMTSRHPQHCFKCSICGKEFPTSQAYGGHISFHSRKVKASNASAECSRPSKKAKNFKN